MGAIGMSFRLGQVVLYLRHQKRLGLSAELMLVYVLRPSGCVGRLASGRISRHASAGLMVYDRYGRVVEYLSGPSGNVRSWCLMGPAGEPVDGWHEVQPEDRGRILPA
jgi:hypothetical protein